MVSVYTYNLLSTKLASADWHVGCAMEHLMTEHRWRIIKDRLSVCVKAGSIVCVQELSEEWITKLLVYFHSLKYTFVYDSAFLGVGIAFPQTYNLENVSIVAVGDAIKTRCKVLPKPSHFFGRILEYLRSLFHKEVSDAWQLAIQRKNRYLGVALSDEKCSFNVYTYHMPCAFNNPPLMAIHASGLLSLVQKEADGKPYIIAGDFNSNVNSEVYKMITQGGKTSTSSKKFLSVPQYSLLAMKSAYFEYNGSEPVFTCNSVSKTTNQLFQATIDYIFYSKHFRVVHTSSTATVLPTRPFPDENEASDHIMIGATLEINDEFVMNNTKKTHKKGALQNNSR
jgi:mRNA deadenylase 3'-5' endonuclease subunit Ccr4